MSTVMADPYRGSASPGSQAKGRSLRSLPPGAEGADVCWLVLHVAGRITHTAHTFTWLADQNGTKQQDLSVLHIGRFTLWQLLLPPPPPHTHTHAHLQSPCLSHPSVPTVQAKQTAGMGEMSEHLQLCASLPRVWRLAALSLGPTTGGRHLAVHSFFIEQSHYIRTPQPALQPALALGRHPPGRNLGDNSSPFPVIATRHHPPQHGNNESELHCPETRNMDVKQAVREAGLTHTCTHLHTDTQTHGQTHAPLGQTPLVWGPVPVVQGLDLLHALPLGHHVRVRLPVEPGSQLNEPLGLNGHDVAHVLLGG